MMKEETRLDCIRRLVAHLESEAPHRTPIEVLRLCKYVPGWGLEKRAVGWIVSGPPDGERFVADGGALVDVLVERWLPQARKEVGASKAVTSAVTVTPPAEPERYPLTKAELVMLVQAARAVTTHPADDLVDAVLCGHGFTVNQRPPASNSFKVEDA